MKSIPMGTSLYGQCASVARWFIADHPMTFSALLLHYDDPNLIDIICMTRLRSLMILLLISLLPVIFVLFLVEK